VSPSEVAVVQPQQQQQPTQPIAPVAVSADPAAPIIEQQQAETTATSTPASVQEGKGPQSQESKKKRKRTPMKNISEASLRCVAIVMRFLAALLFVFQLLLLSTLTSLCRVPLDFELLFVVTFRFSPSHFPLVLYFLFVCLLRSETLQIASTCIR
jgi:hypothetical protein